MNTRYRIRDNADGTFTVTRGERDVINATCRSDAEFYRNNLNAALDENDAQPINQSDEE